VNVLITLGFIGFPALVIWLCTRYKVLEKIGIVLICYLAGMIVGNIGVLPEDFAGVQSLMQDVSVGLALPLLLFSLDVKKWLKVSRAGLLCMLLAVIAIGVATFLLHNALGANVQEGWKLAGMAAAVYTGGTPNLAAMKSALVVDNDTYILFHTYDTVFSLLYILLMATVARAFFQKVFKLRPYRSISKQEGQNSEDIGDESIAQYAKMLKPSIVKGLLAALLLSAGILGISFVVGSQFSVESSTAITILAITSLGIAASFVKPVHRIKHTFQLGMYIIYIFCFTVASMTKFSVLLNINWPLFWYVFLAIFGSLMIHALLAKVFRIDSDTLIVTSVSAICSPPFVPVVVSGLKNREVLISGLITGIIGYAVGNYLGIGLAMLYRMLG